MDGFDLNGLMGMMGGLQQQLDDMQTKAAALRVDGTAGGGLVKVTVTGDQQVVAVVIAPEAMEDRELLEDMVRAAMDAALANAKTTMADILSDASGGLPLPPGLIPGL